MKPRFQLVLLTWAATATGLVLGRICLSAVEELCRAPSQSWGPWALSAVVVAAGTGAGAVGSAWHAASAVLALVALSGGGVGPADRASRVCAMVISRWGAPAVRRLAAGALVVGLTGAPALAQTTAPPEDLGWGPTSSSPSDTGGRGPEPAPPPERDGQQDAAGPEELGPDPAGTDDAPDTTEDPPVSASGHSVVIHPGDCLWSVTSEALSRGRSAPAPPPASEVAAAWPAVYEANREVIGADPDLLLPGTTLTLPDELPQ